MKLQLTLNRDVADQDQKDAPSPGDAGSRASEETPGADDAGKDAGNNKDAGNKESRLARHKRVAREIYAEPRSLGRHIRDGFVSVWVARGAGFYGLGWIVTFIVLEINLFTGEVMEADSLGGFLGGQLLEYVMRIGFMSFINSLMAFVWPVYVLEWMGGYGLLLLVGGYLAFEKLLRPAVESRVPELAAAREAALEEAASKAEKKAAKAGRKAEKKAAKQAKRD